MTPASLRLESHLPGAPGTLPGDLLRGRDRAWELYPPEARDFDSGRWQKGTAAGSRHDSEGAGGDSAGLGGGVAEAIETSSPEARRKLERILGGDGFLVSTGQQPVLLLGPLYVLYKAMTAIALAETVEERLGVPCMALFWIASDDHDWREVGATRLPDTENRLRTLRLEPPPGREDRAVGPTVAPESVQSLVDELGHILPQSEFVSSYLELIRDAYAPGRTLADGFASLLEGALAPRDCAWIDSAAPAVRRAAFPLYERILADAAGTREALRSGEERVRSAEYEPGIHLLRDAVPLFVDDEAGRRRVRVSEGRAWVGRKGDGRPLEAFVEWAGDRRERLSPNVALRPVLASWLLPIGATVLGPSEMAYWAQLPPLFEWAGVHMPLVRPRFSWTILEGKVEKVLRKVEASPDEFSDGGEDLIARHARAETPDDIRRSLEQLRGDLGEGLAGVEAAVASELPGIRSAVGAARHEAFQVIAELEREVEARVRERSEVLNRQIRKASLHLWPEGRPQERVISPLYYLGRYGSGFVTRLEDAGRERVESLLSRPGRPEGVEGSP